MVSGILRAIFIQDKAISQRGRLFYKKSLPESPSKIDHAYLVNIPY